MLAKKTAELVRLTFTHDSSSRRRKMVPGTWRRVKDGSAHLCCPYCRTQLVIEKEDIDGDGVVRAPLFCGGKCCRFRAWVTLRGWYLLLKSEKSRKANQYSALRK
jgi:hypothetical protein